MRQSTMSIEREVYSHIHCSPGALLFQRGIIEHNLVLIRESCSNGTSQQCLVPWPEFSGAAKAT
jgi:hypothetical protein